MINNFSVNMLKTYQLCPKKFYYKYVEKFSSVQIASPFEKGKKVHALANYFLRGVNISRIETALSVDEYEMWQKLLNNKFFKMDCFKTEFVLQIKLGDFWVGGRLDAIMKNGNDYYILDYKTGAIPQNPTFDLQTMVYCLALDKYVQNYNSLSFVYINLKKDENIIINFSQSLKNEYTKKIKDICKKIKSDNIYDGIYKDCKYCEFSKICN